MTTLAREFDACGECRLEVGGPDKYRTLSNDEILDVVAALEGRRELLACASVLPGAIYMDPPDGGDVSVMERPNEGVEKVSSCLHSAVNQTGYQVS